MISVSGRVPAGLKRRRTRSRGRGEVVIVVDDDDDEGFEVEVGALGLGLGLSESGPGAVAAIADWVDVVGVAFFLSLLLLSFLVMSAWLILNACSASAANCWARVYMA